MKLRWMFEVFLEDQNSEDDQSRKALSAKSDSIDIEQLSNETMNGRLFEESKLLEFCEEIIQYFKPRYQ
jgi:hypothetical protein